MGIGKKLEDPTPYTYAYALILMEFDSQVS